MQACSPPMNRPVPIQNWSPIPFDSCHPAEHQRASYRQFWELDVGKYSLKLLRDVDYEKMMFSFPETLSEAVKMLKIEYAVRAIKKYNIDRAIIFCRTKVDCDNLERYFIALGREFRGFQFHFPQVQGRNSIPLSSVLGKEGEKTSMCYQQCLSFLTGRGSGSKADNPFSCVCLHGDRKPHERKNNYDSFKQGHVRFLICTDVAARGLDIGGLPFSKYTGEPNCAITGFININGHIYVVCL